MSFQQRKKDNLLKLCEKFIEDNQIRCGEDVFQVDKVIENAYEFLHEMCNIVGYYDDEKEPFNRRNS